MKKALKKHAEKVRFVIVGASSTAIDFGILFALVLFGLPSLISNYISTTIALIFSFTANKKITFKNSNQTTLKHLGYFLVITLFGLWVIQPVFIFYSSLLMQEGWFIEGNFIKFIISLIQLIVGPWFDNKYFILLTSKALATGVTMVWNYLLYKKFVFPDTIPEIPQKQ